jgi:hypothetical protein
LYKSARWGQNKIRHLISFRQKTTPSLFFDTEKQPIGKSDNVKTSPNRQVKAQPSRTFFGGTLLFPANFSWKDESSAAIRRGWWILAAKSSRQD